jgi:DNA-binding PadR family transcriptional regulator
VAVSRNDFLSGNDTAALYALTNLNRPSTGAEVHHDIQARSSTPYTLTSIYKCLDRLKNRGFVSFEERDKTYRDSSSRKVRYYQITDAGREALVTARTLHEEMGSSLGERARAALRGLALPLGGRR